MVKALVIVIVASLLGYFYCFTLFCMCVAYSLSTHLHVVKFFQKDR